MIIKGVRQSLPLYASNTIAQTVVQIVRALQKLCNLN